MTRWRILLMLTCLLSTTIELWAQHITVTGRVVDESSRQPIEFASIQMKENGQWAITDVNGNFSIKGVSAGKTTMTVQCLGYATQTLVLTITKNIPKMNIKLKQESLKLDEVTVTARRKQDEATTSFTIDRTALDQQQILNIGDVSTLLPGGKTTSSSLMSDNRFSLRSGSQERGNASFGTAVEIDGVRLDNNSMIGETAGASTRNISASNIESVEVVTGIPSVEYGDLSNGIVKVNTRRGKSPFIVEGKISQLTRQIALNKGFDMGRSKGVLNVSLEHARSFSDAASPYTAYQRNILSLHYMNVFMRNSMPLTLNLGVSGNMGGYSSKADPDEMLDDYQKVHDNSLRGHFDVNWLLNKSWITNLSVKGSLSYADKKSENYYSTSSASAQPYIHSMEQGYFIATDYDENPLANIILGPTGYWYVKRLNDSKPMSWSLKLKVEKNMSFAIGKSSLRNHLMIGSDFTGSRNTGRGTYYDDMRYAPTWREYRYDELPAMNNLAIYAEDKIMLPTGKLSTLELTAGLRDDITLISGSDYGTVSSLSPRINSRYIFWRNRRKRMVNSLTVHAGWGKSVKLPSFQILYPTPGYSDRLAFASTSTSDNRSYYAYHTYVSSALYNPDLRWQYTNQTDVGVELDIKGTHISLSAFHHKTSRSYMSTDVFSPMTYRYTSPSTLNASGIAVADRRFTVDQQTGVVTVSDATGAVQSKELAYTERNTYAVNNRYINGSDVDRYGLEWIIDFAQIKSLSTSIRIDGNYYYYQGADDMLFADIPLGVSTTMTGNVPYGYVGWYRGASVTGTGSSASASVSNGTVTKQANLNLTLTTHIPKIRMIVSMRLESSLYNYRKLISDYSFDDDGLAAVYPEYYTAWNNPTDLIPFAEKYLWARDNDATLYNDLSKLVVHANYPYVLNPNRLSSYYSANLSVTKELGDHIALSFYANNFFRNMSTVHSSQTDLDTSLFSSGYIPSFYYGLSLRLKI
ncbi:MAG: TonB-dependent receptor [Prevotella sp.]|nr:TonB-dependent receptor [Prevotella sp.]